MRMSSEGVKGVVARFFNDAKSDLESVGLPCSDESFLSRLVELAGAWNECSFKGAQGFGPEQFETLTGYLDYKVEGMVKRQARLALKSQGKANLKTPARGFSREAKAPPLPSMNVDVALQAVEAHRWQSGKAFGEKINWLLG